MNPPEGLEVFWASRERGAEIQWDILSAPASCLPEGALVLHLAGVTAGSAEDLQRNSAMIAPLVRTAQESGTHRILFASTAAVYGRRSTPALETEEPQPLALYGAAKLAAERQLLAQDIVPVTILRISNVVGADALLGARSGAGKTVLDPVEGRSGGPIRSWIGPRQLASVIGKLAQLTLPKVLNIASDPPFAMADLLQADGRPWCYGPFREGVLDYAVLDTQLLQGLCKCENTTPAKLAKEAAWARDVLR